MCKEAKARGAGQWKREGEGRSDAAPADPSVRSSGPQAPLSGTTRRHTGVPGQECEAVCSCVPVLISNAPVCASHSLLAARGSGSDMRDSIFGINRFHTQAKNDHTQMLTVMIGDT